MPKQILENTPLIKEWLLDKNSELGLDPSKLTIGCGKKAWWKCSECHNVWEATIASRGDGHGCPYCSGNRVSEGINDLQTLYPVLAEEWHPIKNGELLPNMVSAFSSKKVWWKGKCGHEWKALISNRANGSGCPKCKLSAVSSFPEQAIFYYLKKVYSDTLTRDTHLGIELDIYVPSIRVAIEYDGEAWHKGNKIKSDIKKNKICSDNRIKMIRIREQKLDPIDNCIVFVREKTSSDQSLEDVIKELFKYLNLDTKIINIKRDSSKILKQYSAIKVDNSLENCFPEIAKEWNYERNGNLLPNQISKGSRRIVWWKGKCGHEWEMSIDERTHVRKNGKSYGCPYCASKRILKGFNDLESLYPQISKEWNYDKNDDFPSNYMINSNRTVWWKCSKGHEWEAKIQSRTHSNSGCPYCANKKVLSGFNDLKTMIPELALDWDYNKNGFGPEEVTCGSNKKAFWKCQKCGYEWNTYITSRATKKTKCPNCKFDIYKKDDK